MALWGRKTPYPVKEENQLNETAMNAMLNREANINSEDGINPTNYEENPISKWELETLEELDNLRMDLLGMKQISPDKIMQISKPLVNNLGVNQIMIHVQALAKKTIMLSYFSKEIIDLSCRNFRKAIRDELAYNGDSWDVEQINKPVIQELLDNYVYGILGRALLGFTAKNRKTSVISKELNAPNMQRGITHDFPNT